MFPKVTAVYLWVPCLYTCPNDGHMNNIQLLYQWQLEKHAADCNDPML
jgi:hypothetical protein